MSLHDLPLSYLVLPVQRIKADWLNPQLQIKHLVDKYDVSHYRLLKLARAGGWGRKVQTAAEPPKPKINPRRGCNHCAGREMCKIIEQTCLPLLCESQLDFETGQEIDRDRSFYQPAHSINGSLHLRGE